MSEELREGKRRVLEEIFPRIAKEAEDRLGVEVVAEWKCEQNQNETYTLLVSVEGDKKEARIAKEDLEDVGYQGVWEAVDKIENTIRKVVGLSKDETESDWLK